MDNGLRHKLLGKRRALQELLEAEDFVRSHLEPFLEVLEQFRKEDVSYKIKGLIKVASEYQTYISTVLEQTPYTDYGFRPDQLEAENIEDLLTIIFDRYPSVTDFRYLPDLPMIADYDAAPRDLLVRDGLRQAVASLTMSDQLVYVYYLRYAPVLEISLYDLINTENADMYNSLHGDAVIFSETGEWLIAFSLEEKWYAGCTK